MGCHHGSGDGCDRPKSLGRWVKLTLLLNGHRPEDGLTLEDAMDLCSMYEKLRRAVPRSKWIERMMEEDAEAALNNFL